MSKQILVPVDGSEHSGKVLETAVTLAKARGDGITLLHVIPHLSVPEGFKRYMEVEGITAPAGQIYETTVGMNVLHEFSEKATDLGMEEVEKTVASGDVASHIVDAADELHADMIVMGAHGMGAWQGAILGSVAQKVTHSAKCTVITVH